MNNNLATVFPTTEVNWHNENVRTEGLLIRDYFAAKAMQGMLAYPGDEQRGSHHNNNDYDGVSSMAYAYADAMLEARNK